MSKDFNFSYSVVAFIDVLGQKEAFQNINKMPENEEEERVLIQAFKDTAYFIEKLREGFDGCFNSLTEEKESKMKVPESKKEEFDQMRKTRLKHTRFSDCIQAYVPLQSEQYHAPSINGVFGLLYACGLIQLLSLAEGKPFRAGIDCGIGTELSSGEIYGPGFFNAYALESKIAHYPRIVVGDELINYLMHLSNKIQQFPGQTTEDIQVCKITADICLDMISKDIDGHNILDYIGDKFYKHCYKKLIDDERKKMSENFKKAFDFVESEYKKRRKTKDSKLAQRYFLLHRYFKAREKVFISE